MHPHLDPNLAKAAVGGVFSVASWGLGQITQSVDAIPDIVKAADTPLIIAGMGWAIVHLWKSWQLERKARIEDIDKAFERMQKDAEAAAASRERLIQATTVQTEEFKALRRAVEARQTPLYQNREPQ